MHSVYCTTESFPRAVVSLCSSSSSGGRSRFHHDHEMEAGMLVIQQCAPSTISAVMPCKAVNAVEDRRPSVDPLHPRPWHDSRQLHRIFVTHSAIVSAASGSPVGTSSVDASAVTGLRLRAAAAGAQQGNDRLVHAALPSTMTLPGCRVESASDPWHCCHLPVEGTQHDRTHLGLCHGARLVQCCGRFNPQSTSPRQVDLFRTGLRWCTFTA